MSPSITPRQKAFADAILAGIRPSPAYLKSGYAVGSPKVVSVKAQQVLNSFAVQQYLSTARAKLEAEDILTRKEAVGILARIAKAKGGVKATSRDRIAAVAQASRMLGYDAPSKVEMKVEGSLLHRIRNAK